MTSDQKEAIKRRLKFDKCSKCGSKHFIAYFESIDEYAVDLTTPTLEIGEYIQDNIRTTLIIECANCGMIMVSDYYGYRDETNNNAEIMDCKIR
jgi:hypothetical protein